MDRKPLRHVHQLKKVKFQLVHEEFSINFIQKIVRNFNPDIIVELGTGHGGMTAIFNNATPRSVLHSFDINQQIEKPMRLYNKNVFFYSEDLLKEPNIVVIDILKQKGKKFLYCDNGNKIKEVKYYSPYLNIGDMLGVHDWGEDREITYNDIKEELIGFKPLEHKLFEMKGFSSRFWIKEF